MSSRTSQAHIKALKRVMEYCLSTRERGLVLEPNHSWDGDPEFELQILGDQIQIMQRIQKREKV